jgi:hypothetical protein
MAGDSPEQPRPVRVLHKVIGYIAVWALALFATNPSGSFWALAYLFPLGLAAFLNLRWGNDGGWGGLGLCIAIYVAQAIFYFRSKTVRSTALWLGILIILLICNVAGCRAQLPR